MLSSKGVRAKCTNMPTRSIVAVTHIYNDV